MAAGIQLSGHGLFQGGCRGQEVHFYSVMTNTRESGAVFYCGFAFPINFLLSEWISHEFSVRWSPVLGQDTMALCSNAALTSLDLPDIYYPLKCSFGIKATFSSPAPSDRVPETEPEPPSVNKALWICPNVKAVEPTRYQTVFYST